MGATFTRIKNWVKETLSHEDLNKEIDNILENLDPQGVGDYSENAAQMKLVTDPGTEGSESLPTSLAGEIERLRFMVQQITGETPWYASVGTNLKEVSNFIAAQATSDRIISARTTGNSPRAKFLIPGGNDSVTLKASPEDPFVYSIGGNTYTLTEDVTLDGFLGSAETTTETIILPTGVTAGTPEKYLGVGGYGLILNTSDANDGFAIVDYPGVFELKDALGNIEYAMRVPFRNLTWESPTEPPDANIFYDWSASDYTQQVVFTGLNRKLGVLPDDSFAGQISVDTGTTIRGLTTRHLFIDAEGVLHVGVALNNELPRPSAITPGIYWRDPRSGAWSRSNGTIWEVVPHVYVGFCAIDTDNSCVMAHSADIATPRVQAQDNCLKAVHFLGGGPSTAFDLHIMSNFSFAGNTFFAGSKLSLSATTGSKFIYLKPDGSLVEADLPPHDLRATLGGWFHPEEQWLCVAVPSFNDPFTVTTASDSPRRLNFSNFFDFDDGITGDLIFGMSHASRMRTAQHVRLDLFLGVGTQYYRADIHYRLYGLAIILKDPNETVTCFDPDTLRFGFPTDVVPRTVHALGFTRDSTVVKSGILTPRPNDNPHRHLFLDSDGSNAGEIFNNVTGTGGTAVSEVRMQNGTGDYAISSRPSGNIGSLNDIYTFENTQTFGSGDEKYGEDIPAPIPSTLVIDAYIRV